LKKKKKIIFSGLSGFMRQMLLKQESQDMFTTEKLETLGLSIIKVNQGKIIMNETVKKNLALIAKQSKVNVCIVSNREVEVLRYLWRVKES
jgi:hypothetical protein